MRRALQDVLDKTKRSVTIEYEFVNIKILRAAQYISDWDPQALKNFLVVIPTDLAIASFVTGIAL